MNIVSGLVLGESLRFALVAAAFAFAAAPFLTHFLYKWNITVGRRGGADPTLNHGGRHEKRNTPTMGGILVIAVVALLTIGFNWNRAFTWMPIGVMLLSAALGGLDDLLNIFGKERRSRKLSQVFTLIRVHKSILMRIWYVITLPWTAFKRLTTFFSHHPGKGIHVHEKLLLQFLAGAITAWWIYYKLAASWQTLYIPFTGFVDIGWILVPLIIFIVMFTANAVNIADGMDGLAGGMMIPSFAALMLLSWLWGFPEMAILNAVVFGSLITYTYFNIKPARFQMGDVGSLGLGALLAINALVINATAILPLIGFMFYIEALSVIIQVLGRFFLGRRIFRMAPIHHHFELKGWSEEKTIMRFWVVHLAFVILGVWVALH